MPSRSNRSSSTDANTTQDNATMMSEQAKQQLVMASEVSSVMCRAAEALQQIQQHGTQRAALRYQQMADQVRSANSSAEMMAIQSTLMTQGLQEMAQYMHDMTTATLKIQGMLMENQRSQDGNSMASQAATATVNAWQQMMSRSNGAGGFAAH